MSMQQEDNTHLKAVRKWVGCTDSMPELLATELVIRQYRWRSSLDLYKYKAQKSKICEVAVYLVWTLALPKRFLYKLWPLIIVCALHGREQSLGVRFDHCF